MTAKEAIEQGYKYWAYKDNDGEPVRHLTDVANGLEEPDYENQPCLIDKQGRQAVAFNPDDISEMVVQQAADWYYDSTGNDDTSEIEEAIEKKVDFAPLADAINEAIKGIICYAWTKIPLEQEKGANA